YKDRPDLSYLEENIYKKNIAPYDKKVENISLHVSKDIESEVDFLINKINYLRRTYGYSLNDIKVVAPEISEYADILIKKCEEYDINVYVDNKKNIYNSPLVELIRSLFDVLLYNFSYDSVMRYLNCGLFNKKYNKNIYLFDNAIRKYGIKGYKKYQELLEKKKVVFASRKTQVFKDNIEEHIDEIIDIKDKLLNDVIDLYKSLSYLKEKYTINEYIEKIESFLEKAKIYELFNDVIDEFEDKSDFDYLVLKDNERLIKNIFDKIKVLSKDDKEKIEFSDIRDLFNVSIEGKTIPLSPPTMEELECGDLMRSRFDNPKVLFFLGLNESKIPRKSKDNNIIDDDMRLYFKNTEGIVLSQTTKE
ncbi:MAG: hypothetical protein MJ151_04690, partial [Lachnospiraceae bacterium]|nr:hypothetical protein [Lachnospiraceae bacterium]